MTTFADMQAAVIAQTKRPELVAVTDSAIRMATLRAHQVDFFPRDQANVQLTFAVLGNNQIFVDIPDIYTQVPRIRTPDFVQSLDVNTLMPNEILEYVVDYKNFWDEYNELKSSVFTMLGNTLRIRSLANSGKAQLYFYQNPDTSTATYNSWIADLYKEELALWAAAIVWQRSGFQEIAAGIQTNNVLPFKDMLVSSHLSSKV